MYICNTGFDVLIILNQKYLSNGVHGDIFAHDK